MRPEPTSLPGEREVAGLRCGEVLACLSDYLDDDLPPGERLQVEAHVRGCDGCARFGGRFAALVTRLRAQLANPGPITPEVADRLAARLAAGK
jgi:anti-sigma factor RsiW